MAALQCPIKECGNMKGVSIMKQIWAVGVREYAPNSFRIRVERMPEDKGDKFDMAGTEGTHQYTVYATVKAEECQIAKHLTTGAGWKQPGDGGQDRFSLICSKGEVDQKLGAALKAVGVHKTSSGRKVNPDVASKLGVNAYGPTAHATVANRLIRLAATAKPVKAVSAS